MWAFKINATFLALQQQTMRVIWVIYCGSFYYTVTGGRGIIEVRELQMNVGRKLRKPQALKRGLRTEVKNKREREIKTCYKARDKANGNKTQNKTQKIKATQKKKCSQHLEYREAT